MHRDDSAIAQGDFIGGLTSYLLAQHWRCFEETSDVLKHDLCLIARCSKHQHHADFAGCQGGLLSESRKIDG
jgi:hypothetical protein